MNNPYLPWEAEVVERVQESASIVTLRIRFTDPAIRRRYRFDVGQFNMVYLYGVGEIPVSIVSDPQDEQLLDHIVRAIGRVTRALVTLKQGDRLGIRGPYGRGWPLHEAVGKDVVLITGGLGCAPVMSVINFIVKRREHFGKLTILQGVKHANDLIWRTQYERWAMLPNTQVLLAADVAGPQWQYLVGKATILLDRAVLDATNSIAMMCGPEIMMQACVTELLQRGFNPESLWLSMERNMQCAVKHCGHCQYGPHFVCQNGPVFQYPEIDELFGHKGF